MGSLCPFDLLRAVIPRSVVTREHYTWHHPPRQLEGDKSLGNPHAGRASGSGTLSHRIHFFFHFILLFFCVCVALVGTDNIDHIKH